MGRFFGLLCRGVARESKIFRMVRARAPLWARRGLQRWPLTAIFSISSITVAFDQFNELRSHGRAKFGNNTASGRSSFDEEIGIVLLMLSEVIWDGGA